MQCTVPKRAATSLTNICYILFHSSLLLLIKAQFCVIPNSLYLGLLFNLQVLGIMRKGRGSTSPAGLTRLHHHDSGGGPPITKKHPVSCTCKHMSICLNHQNVFLQQLQKIMPYSTCHFVLNFGLLCLT